MRVIYDEAMRVPVKAWTDKVGEIEESAMEQLRNCASMPFIFKHVAVMPDVHAGYGATVGSVIPTKGAVMPAAVGVDIGCGMTAQPTSLTANDLPDSLTRVRSAIEAAVPHGRTNNGQSGDKGAWANNGPSLSEGAANYLGSEYERLAARHPDIFHRQMRAHMGTLGTGNHFIEICLDEESRVWVMLHSGSRGVGNRIGTYFTKQAGEYCAQHFIDLPSKDLGYFPEGSQWFTDYVEAVTWAQEYARLNRACMMDQTLGAISGVLGRSVYEPDLLNQRVDCHHNYMAKENHFGANVLVTRKGAVRARRGDMGIIPGSMGACSFIVRGLGNHDSFNSCSHGAGRKMSRTAARNRFTVEDHKLATAGVECRKDDGVLDETPGAYKDIEAVMESQKDLVKVLHRLKQVVCVKG